MKSMRKHLLLVIALFAVLFAVGSFADLAINQALFSEKNTVGLFFAAIGMAPGYGLGAFLCGILVTQAGKKENKTPVKLLLCLVAAVIFVIALYYSASDIFSVNGFYHPGRTWLAMLMMLPVMGLYFWFGLRHGKEIASSRKWIVVLIILAAIMVILLAGTVGIKNIMHRPRFRSAVYYGYTEFHPWWRRCADYKEIMVAAGLTSEEFKSFPSGHASISALTMLFALVLPIFVPKARGKQVSFFYMGLACTLLISFMRLLVGAHYLSDISMGALITLVVSFVLNEILIRNKKLQAIVEE